MLRYKCNFNWSELIIYLNFVGRKMQKLFVVVVGLQLLIKCKVLLCNCIIGYVHCSSPHSVTPAYMVMTAFKTSFLCQAMHQNKHYIFYMCTVAVFLWHIFVCFVSCRAEMIVLNQICNLNIALIAMWFWTQFLEWQVIFFFVNWLIKI